MTKKQIKRKNRGKIKKAKRINPVKPLDLGEIDKIAEKEEKERKNNIKSMINIANNANNKDNNIKNNHINTDTDSKYGSYSPKIKNPSENPSENPSKNPSKNPFENPPHSKTQSKTQKRRKIQKHSLLKLYERDVITTKQYAAGERLIRDYENSFKNYSSLSLKIARKNKAKSKGGKQNPESGLIQNIRSWERYAKAIISIDDGQTREIAKQFCIDGVNLTELDKKLKKRGVAELRLICGLNDLAKHYRELRKEE
jgi:hypothetical protein